VRSSSLYRTLARRALYTPGKGRLTHGYMCFLRQACATHRRAGVWRTPRSGTGGCRQRWTGPAATARTAATSSPARRATSPTPRLRTPRTRSTATTSVSTGPAVRATSPALPPSSTRSQVSYSHTPPVSVIHPPLCYNFFTPLFFYRTRKLRASIEGLN
jgi:hypothetical protein